MIELMASSLAVIYKMKYVSSVIIALAQFLQFTLYLYSLVVRGQ